MEHLDALIDGLLEGAPGPLDIDAAEVKRAYDVSRAQADSVDLKALLQEAARLHAHQEAGLVPQMDDYALAWVEAM